MIGKYIRQALHGFTERAKLNLDSLTRLARSTREDVRKVVHIVSKLQRDLELIECKLQGSSRQGSGALAAPVASIPSPEQLRCRKKLKDQLKLPTAAVQLFWGDGARKEGWISLGTAPDCDIWYDGVEPLDLPDGRVTEIFLDGRLQSLKHPEQTLPCLRECRRLLSPEGKIRIRVPDAAYYLTAGPADLERICLAPQFLNYTAPVDALNYLVRQGETLFSEESVRAALAHAGFGGAERIRETEPATLMLSAAPVVSDGLKMEERPALLVMTFNRHSTLAQLLAILKQYPPSRLYIVQDGPRANNAADHANCWQVRQMVEALEMPCSIKLKLNPTNLGPMHAQKAALDWFFEQEEEGIVLEDDCIPDPSFFRFSAELLAKYRHDSRVMWISGDNFERGIRTVKESYYFSRFPHCWGWASWRRVWQGYDLLITAWPQAKEDGLLSRVFQHQEEREYWTNIFDKSFAGKIRSWDYRMTFHIWKSNGLCILPVTNLIRNIGFQELATNCSNDPHGVADLPTYPINFPLLHPVTQEFNDLADEFTSRSAYGMRID